MHCLLQYNHKFHSKDVAVVIIIWYSFWKYSDIIYTGQLHWCTSGWTAISAFFLRCLVDLRVMNFRKINFIFIIVDFLFPVLITTMHARQPINHYIINWSWFFYIKTTYILWHSICKFNYYTCSINLKIKVIFGFPMKT